MAKKLNPDVKNCRIFKLIQKQLTLLPACKRA